MDVVSDKYSLEDIERALDRLALEIAENPKGKCAIPLYQMLEKQLEIRRQRDATMDSVRARLARMKSS